MSKRKSYMQHSLQQLHQGLLQSNFDEMDAFDSMKRTLEEHIRKPFPQMQQKIDKWLWKDFIVMFVCLFLFYLLTYWNKGRLASLIASYLLPLLVKNN